MICYAKHEFELNKIPKGSKTSLRAQLLQVAKVRGTAPKELINPYEFPDELEYVWDWFVDLSNNSAQLTYLDIYSWSQLTGERPTKQEVGLILQLSRIMKEVYSND